MTYTYHCKECGKNKDYTHGMNETPVYKCCDKQMKKVFVVPLGVHNANTGNRTGT